MGPHYAVGDPYLFAVASRIEGDGVDPARFPRIIDHRRRMAARPAVKWVLAAERN